jgi:DNA mismatch repair protein MutS2
LDLDATSREALELDAVLAYAAGFAASVPGRARLLSLRPSADRGVLESEHAALDEALRYGERFGRLIPARLPDPEPARAALRIDGLLVDPLPLRDLASVLGEAADLRKRLSTVDEAAFPALRGLGASLPDVGGLAREVVSFIGPDGRLEDDASAELRRLRHAIVKTGERLRRQLETLVHDPAAAPMVRDDFVTQRNGRFVIPVRADAPRPVQGIVHAASSSGQTLFVEPIASVEMNNDLVRLTEQEAVEQERILRGWTETYRARLGEVDGAVDGLARADALQARASFAREIEGCRPAIGERSALRLSAARHPLLDRRLREQGSACVPISIEIDPYDRLLLISGPNTGGKTVALKTAGLAVLMAQCGLPVAAAEAVVPVFVQLRADIGDHQSIEADLSTFSGHVRAIAGFLDEAEPPALFLFDEIGTGTEPGEGAALAQAVLERLLTLKITAIATTHHAALKAWAFAHEGVASAAMEFDEETLRPTFRVLAGAAGSSAGISIAGKLGLDPALVARARELVGAGIGAEAYMARLRSLTSEAEAKAGTLREAEAELVAARDRLEAEARADADRRREATARALDAALREFRQQTRHELAGIQDARERARVERAQVKAESRLRASARRAQEAITPSPPAPARPFDVVPGARARIVSLDREGEILAVRGDKVDVRMGAATFSVRRADLTAPGAAAPPPPSLPVRVVAKEAPPGPPLELHLIGKTVDEALPEVDRFLDACAREGRDEVRVVHGHGTGRLRTGVRAHLESHPQVAAFRAGGAGEGGDGATVVTLK